MSTCSPRGCADKALSDGFNCVGFSQGNSLCRGYIQKYNDPPVRNFLSVHGTVSGVAGFPDCNPAGLLGPVCKTLERLVGDMAYTSLTQVGSGCIQVAPYTSLHLADRACSTLPCPRASPCFTLPRHRPALPRPVAALPDRLLPRPYARQHHILQAALAARGVE